jgi:hypothetical protein
VIQSSIVVDGVAIGSVRNLQDHFPLPGRVCQSMDPVGRPSDEGDMTAAPGTVGSSSVGHQSKPN